MVYGGRAKPLVDMFNSAMTAAAGAPLIGRLMSRSITEISYVGRKSGKPFTLPIGYRRAGDEIIIGVMAPDRKAWWHNFRGAGAPLTIRLDGAQRTGHAIARRDGGRVTVRLHLDAP